MAERRRCRQGTVFNDWSGKKTTQSWHEKLMKMRASENMEEDDVRQLKMLAFMKMRLFLWKLR